jgi:hypothetical protein
MHGSGLESILAALPTVFADRAMPELVLIGAEVGQITPFTTALSPPVAAATTQAVELVLLSFANTIVLGNNALDTSVLAKPI